MIALIKVVFFLEVWLAFDIAWTISADVLGQSHHYSGHIGNSCEAWKSEELQKIWFDFSHYTVILITRTSIIFCPQADSMDSDIGM